MTIDNSTLDRLRRIRFALFIKILFRLIEQKDRLVSGEARYIVSSCIRQHLKGSIKYENMIDAIVLNLRGLVHQDTWRAARHYAKVYERKHQNRIQQAAEDDYGLDEVDDQDCIEIEILRPFEIRSSAFQLENDSSHGDEGEEDGSQSLSKQQAASPGAEPEYISSSSLLPSPEMVKSSEYYDPASS